QTRKQTPDQARFEAALARFQEDAAADQAHAERLAHIQAIADPIERARALLDYHQNPGKDPTRPHPTKPEQRARKATKQDQGERALKNPRAGSVPRPDERQGPRQPYCIVRPPASSPGRMTIPRSASTDRQRRGRSPAAGARLTPAATCGFLAI